jgi:carbon monoxide dehydrogenase subunit G
MHLSGKYALSVPVSTTWDALTRKEFLKTVIPGCKELNEIEPDHFKLDIEIGIAGIKGKYAGEVRLKDKNPLKSYRMVVEGNGKPGFVKADGLIEFAEDKPGAATVTYTGEFQAGGLIAGIGQRMLEGVAKLMVNQFFKAVEARLAKTSGRPLDGTRLERS